MGLARVLRFRCEVWHLRARIHQSTQEHTSASPHLTTVQVIDMKYHQVTVQTFQFINSVKTQALTLPQHEMTFDLTYLTVAVFSCHTIQYDSYDWHATGCVAVHIEPHISMWYTADGGVRLAKPPAKMRMSFHPNQEPFFFSLSVMRFYFLRHWQRHESVMAS
jgi:hypothetical protein